MNMIQLHYIHVCNHQTINKILKKKKKKKVLGPSPPTGLPCPGLIGEKVPNLTAASSTMAH